MSNWRFAPVTSANWNDFNTLFEAKGGPSYCWCMAWRPMSDRQTASNADRKAAISALVETGKPIGILAYDGAGKAVGWCSVAPRETFRKLSPQQNDEQEGIWSITCFFVRREHRGTGFGSALLDAAVHHALGQGPRRWKPIRWIRSHQATDSWDSRRCSPPTASARQEKPVHGAM